ncbi:MAG: FHA domain-containing protein [Candidatus Eisenbacteria bacterium]|uniref:FHA domain-containing protein n=1 Tax=Eiseniibacteriota bacterium TaxID=2212470 RepID=A0A538U7F1_UNCEI|nr:MAG: FHA domain-containing protein [Candidatus Eisenbacteria bacterium]
MSRLVRLEKMLERGLGRLRHPETTRELIEAVPDVLDEVEDHLEPSGGRGRVFPYDRVLVTFRGADAERPAARALAKELPERILQRLRARGCEPPQELEIQVRWVAKPRADWGDRWFRVRYRRLREGEASARPAAPVPPPAEPKTLRLTVLRGRTGAKAHELGLARINLGRLEKVASAGGRGTRKNHVWFAASEDTVSRAHARIERFASDYLLFDEGSVGGTRVLRRSEEIELMPRAGRGVRLEDGDRIELGKGCVVEVRMTRDDDASSSR